jgi:hypothetical protein
VETAQDKKQQAEQKNGRGVYGEDKHADKRGEDASCLKLAAGEGVREPLAMAEYCVTF